MSPDDETIPIGEAVRSLESMARRLAEMRRQRDQYREWFDRLFAAAMQGNDDALSAAFDRVRTEQTKLVRAEQTKPARTKRSSDSADHVRRAADLHHGREHLSAPAIGFRLAREDGREDRPYDGGTVRRWLRRWEAENRTD